MIKKILNIALWEVFQKFNKRSYLYISVITPLMLILLIKFSSSGIKQNTSPVTVGIFNTEQVFAENFRELASNFTDNLSQQPELIPVYFGNSENKSDSFIDSLLTKGVIDYVITPGNNGYTVSSRFFRRPSLIPRISLYTSMSASVSFAGYSGMLPYIPVQTFDVSTGDLYSPVNTIKNTLALYLIPIIFVFVVVFAGNSFIRGFALERQGRILEVLLSACTRNELFFGKIIGLLLVSTVHILIWGGLSALLLDNGFNMLSAHPVIGAVFFILGFLLYTSFFVGLAGIITNENQAQQFSSNISLLLIIPLLFSIHVISSPGSYISKILAYFPLTSPTVMLIKLELGNFTYTEILISVIILLLTTILLIKLAVKYFNNGLENLPRQ